MGKYAIPQAFICHRPGLQMMAIKSFFPNVIIFAKNLVSMKKNKENLPEANRDN